MSLKDEVLHVKEELSSDEKILENAFKLEKLYKKYKLLIWGVVILALVGFGANAGWNAYQRSKLDSANNALLALQHNPKDTSAAAQLQSNNPKLYELYQLTVAMHQKSIDKLKTISNSTDPIIADIAKYHTAVLNNKTTDSVYYHDMTIIEQAYQDLKSGKKMDAKTKLSLISEDSPVSKIAELMRHYTINLK